MKEHIHTIPILEALRNPGSCPFCMIQRKLDKDAVDFIMGSAYMEEDIRNKTDDLGFCAGHLRKIYAIQNRLGLALLLHTHFKKIQKNMEVYKNFETPVGIFKKSESTVVKLARLVDDQQGRCYLCEKVEGTFKQYVDTFFYMWPREKEMSLLVQSLPGFCLPHYGMLIGAAEPALNKKHLKDFITTVVYVQQKVMQKLEGDLEWFIQKFDYRNTNASWRNSKDALARAMAMLKGVIEE